MHLAFHFGAAGLLDGRASATLELPNRVIHGTGCERWAEDVRPLDHDPVRCWRAGDQRWGLLAVDLREGFEDAARRAYRQLLAAAGGLSLHRIWNFIPRINAMDGELENYQAFCRGRTEALAEADDALLGAMPAATAVGTPADRLLVMFVAGPQAARHVENPLQVPAYRYPARYGPAAPTFARASVVREAAGRRLYVSGTASIRGSDTLHPDEPAAQLVVALENLDAVARAAGFPQGLNARSPGRRRFRVYLRHAADWQRTAPLLRERLVREGVELHVLQADICRRELVVELEACVTAAPGDESLLRL